MTDYFVCPNCGEDVSPKALSCPDCGSDEKTGWSEDTLYDGLDLPEFDNHEPESPKRIFRNKYFLYIISIISLLAFILMFLL